MKHFITPPPMRIADFLFHSSLGEQTGLTVNLSDAVKNPQRAIDGNLATSSTLGSGLANVGVFSTLSQTIFFKKKSATTDKAVIYLSTGANVLDVGLFSGLSVRAFNGDEPAGASQQLSSLINLELLGFNIINGIPSNTIIPFYYTPTGQFDRVIVTLSSTVNATLFSGGINIHDIAQVSQKPSISSKLVYQFAGATPSVNATTTSGNPIFWQGPLPARTNLTTNAVASAAPFPVAVSASGNFVAVSVKTGCTTNFSDSTRLRVVVFTDETTSLTGKRGQSFAVNSAIKVSSVGLTNITYSTTSTLPNGLTFNASNGAITGTPTSTATVGNTQVVVKILVGGVDTGLTLTKNITIDNYDPLVVNNSPLPNSYVGTIPYGATSIPVPTGGSGIAAGYTYATTGTVPPGLTISESGIISGATSAVGSYSFGVTVTDPASGTSVIQNYTVVVGPALVANPGPLAIGITGQAYTTSVLATGGSGSYTYALSNSSGALPTGLTLNSNGTISGTVTGNAGEYPITVVVSDPTSGQTVEKAYILTIYDPLVANTATLPTSYVSATFYGAAAIPAPSGGSGAALQYALTGTNPFPTGLTLNSNGTISGFTTDDETYTFTVRITDPTTSLFVDQTYTVVVYPKLSLPGGTFPSTSISETTYEASINDIQGGAANAEGGRGSAEYIYSLTAPTQRAMALTLNLSTDGTLTTNPSDGPEGTNTFTVYVTDGEQTTSALYSLTITGSLPVKLTNFTVKKEGQSALLTWATTEEVNSESFDVERSNNGKQWIAIGNVRTKGESASIIRYNFPDQNPVDGENLYRLKMIDKDGTFAYSGIQSVNFNMETIKLYPNPITGSDQLSVQIKDWNNVKTVKVINAIGKVVFESAGSTIPKITASQLGAGLYIVEIVRKDGQIATSKFVKL